MSKTLTDSLALLTKIKTQFQTNNYVTQRQSKENQSADIKNFGSIKRSQVNAAPVIKNHQAHTNANTKGRMGEQSQLRHRFEMDFQNLQHEIYQIFDRARNI